jgi:hypothetical protein
LLSALEAVAENPLEFAKRKEYMLPVFAIYLLAQFRERRAYPLVVKMLSAPEETPFDLIGDTVTEGLKRILATVYDGNPAPLQGLIESEEVNEYVRAAALNAFLVLEHTGQMPRAEVIEYYRSLFHGKLQRTPSFAWCELVCNVADLPAPELLEDMRQAYADDLVDSSVADLEGLERDLTGQPLWRREDRTLITDAIGEMKGWACFHQEDSPHTELQEEEEEVPPPPAPTPYVPPKPFIREPKVGRNDPCPCGSSKKYKKCCGKE